jgi:hypothetical protein
VVGAGSAVAYPLLDAAHHLSNGSFSRLAVAIRLRSSNERRGVYRDLTIRP